MKNLTSSEVYKFFTNGKQNSSLGACNFEGTNNYHYAYRNKKLLHEIKRKTNVAYLYHVASSSKASFYLYFRDKNKNEFKIRLSDHYISEDDVNYTKYEKIKGVLGRVKQKIKEREEKKGITQEDIDNLLWGLE